MSEPPEKIDTKLLKISALGPVINPYTPQIGQSVTTAPVFNHLLASALPLIPDDTKLFYTIGKIASSWAWFETEVDVQCVDLLGVDEIGHCLTSQISGIRRKLAAFLTAAKHKRAKDSVVKFGRFVDRAVKLSERRNRVVHDSWLMQQDGVGSRYEITAQHELKAGPVRVRVDDLIALQKEIVALLDEFDSIAAAVRAEILALPEKQP